jgi:hypothetical protein
MSDLTLPPVWDRINSVVARTPFAFTQAREPFSFELQPATNLDQVYRVDAELTETIGYIGPAQCEEWAVTIWLARMHQGKPQTAYRRLQVDCTSLASAWLDDALAGDYNVDGFRSSVALPPEGDAPYLVGQLRAIVDFDRAL